MGNEALFAKEKKEKYQTHVLFQITFLCVAELTGGRGAERVGIRISESKP